MAHLFLILASIIWGSNFAVAKILVTNLDPFAFNAMRWALTAIFIFLLYSKTMAQDWKQVKNNLGLYLSLALFGQVGNQLLLTIGIQYSTALNALIFMSFAPAIVLIIDLLFFKKPITENTLLGVILSTGGVLFLIFSQPAEHFIFKYSDLFFLAAAISWAIYLSLMKFKPATLGNQSFVGFSAIFAAIMLTAIAFIYFDLTGGIRITKEGFSPSTWGFLAYTVIFPSWIAYLLLAKGIAKLGSASSSLYTHVIPLSGAFLSITVLGEELHGYHLIAAGAITAGIMLSSKK